MGMIISYYPRGTPIINTNAGNHPVYYAAINETNENEIYDDYKKYKTYPFVFVQNKDKMTVQLYDRTATEKIKQWNNAGWIVGAGWDIMRTAPAILAGYHWEHFGVIGQFTISSNFGVVIGFLWMP